MVVSKESAPCQRRASLFDPRILHLEHGINLVLAESDMIQ